MWPGASAPSHLLHNPHQSYSSKPSPAKTNKHRVRSEQFFASSSQRKWAQKSHPKLWPKTRQWFLPDTPTQLWDLPCLPGEQAFWTGHGCAIKVGSLWATTRPLHLLVPLSGVPQASAASMLPSQAVLASC